MIDKHSPQISVLYVFRDSREKKLQLWQAAQGPDEMLYGLNHLDPGKFQVDLIESDYSQWNWIRYLWYPIEYLIRIRLKMGFRLYLALDNLKKIQQADVIISTVDMCGLPIAMLKYLGTVKTPMIYISQGLSDRFGRFSTRSLTHRFFCFFYGLFLQSIEKVLVLGEGSIEPLIKIFDLKQQRVSSLFFGVDDQFWFPDADRSPESYILSVGSDLARDYETLLKAVTDGHLKIVTRLPIPHDWLREHVEIGSDFTDVQLRGLYQRARFVVIPLKDVAQPSGQSATLQAMACGKAVILTRTRGLWEPEHMRHLDNCYLVEPGDVAGLKQAIRYLSDHPDEAGRIGRSARQTVEKRYNSRRMASELERHIGEVLSLQMG